MSATGPRATTRDLRRARIGITAIAVVTLLLVLVAGAALILRSYRAELVSQVDDQLRRSAVGVALFASGRLTIEGDALEIPVQLVNDDGAAVSATGPLEGEPPLWDPSRPRDPHTARSAAMGEVRILPVRYNELWLVLVEPLDEIDREVRALRGAMLVALPLLALTLGFIVWLAVGRALRPVGAAIEREEQLVADVSHELRSPIAGIRVLLETEPNDPTELTYNRRAALAELGRLEVVTDQLLQLARRRHGAPAARVAPVDLDEIVLREVERLGPRSERRIDTGSVAPGQVVGVEAALRSMVDNLLTNALRHAASTVRTTLTENGDTVELTVEDDGPGIPVDARAKVVQRFTRLDEARSRAGGGAGLGLAIVQEIVDAHGGTLSIGDASIGGARVRVRLPASVRASTDPTAFLSEA